MELTGRFAFRKGLFGTAVLQCEVRKPHPWSNGPGSWVYFWRDVTLEESRDYFDTPMTVEPIIRR